MRLGPPNESEPQSHGQIQVFSIGSIPSTAGKRLYRYLTFHSENRGSLRKWELVQQLPVLRAFLDRPLETADREGDVSGGSEGGVFDPGGTLFRQVDDLYVRQPILGLVRIALIAHLAGDLTEIVIQPFQGCVFFCKQPEPADLIVDIHSDDIPDGDLEGAQGPAILAQALLQGSKIVDVSNGLYG